MSDGALKKISRVVFWRYRRGGWQYDILCIFILLFIFLVPRPVLDGSYFNDGAARGIRGTMNQADPPAAEVSPEDITPEENQDTAED